MRSLLVIAAAALTWSTATQADNPIDNPYQQSFTRICGEGGNCGFVFPAVARETLIMHTSCTFQLTKPGVGISLLGIQGGSVYNELQFSEIITSDGITVYGTNAATYLFVSAGQQPYIQVFGANAPVTDLNCTISGYQRP
jgi:hypothetical protein